MISWLLFYKILQLFIFMLLGYILVKIGILKSEDSRALSGLSLYLLMPAVIINSFDVEFTGEILGGMGVAFVSAVVIHMVLLVIDRLYKGICKASVIERASAVYSNSGNLIIPVVSFVLGEEWVIYTCAFLSVQLLVGWTHGISLFTGELKFNFRKIILNVNILSIIIGVIMMLSGMRLPSLLKDVVSPLGNMLGTVSMLIAGMLAARINYKKYLKSGRFYFVLFMRMIFCPLIMLFIMFLLSRIFVTSDKVIFLISYLAGISPVAAVVMQFAQITGNDGEYAAALNIVSTMLCIFTMPIFIELFNIFI